MQKVSESKDSNFCVTEAELQQCFAKGYNEPLQFISQTYKFFCHQQNSGRSHIS